jgi:transposase
VLDCWQRSQLSATDFAPLVGVSVHTLYAWRKRFEAHGPAGLTSAPRGTKPGSRLPEPTKRAVLMLKRAHPEWGCERLHDVLLRSEGYGASPGAIGRLLKEQGYEPEERASRSHPPKVSRFERSRPNQLWQSDLFTFVLKRERRRVTWWCFSTTTAAFWWATVCTRARRGRWCGRCWRRRWPTSALRRRC